MAAPTSFSSIFVSLLIMEFVYTFLEIGGILIEEPVTSLTDVVTGLVGLVAFIRLNRLNSPNRGEVYFRYYFLFIGMATVCAGLLGHATQYIVGYNAKTIGWTLSAIALCCLEHAALEYFMDARTSGRLKKLRGLFWGKLFVFLIFEINPGTRVFELVQVNAAFAMVGVIFPLFLATHRMQPSAGSLAVIIAIVAGFVPGLVFRTQFSLHTYLNYHDISHLLMAMSVYLFYRAARLLVEERAISNLELEAAD